MKKIKRLIRILICIIIPIFIISIYTSTIPTYDISIKKTIAYRNKDNKDLDLIIFGDSITSRAFIPQIIYDKTGYEGYNSGENAIRANRMLTYIEDLYKYQSPQLLIIDTNPFTYNLCCKEETQIKENKGKLENLFNNHEYWRKYSTSCKTLKDKGYNFRDASVKMRGDYDFTKTNEQVSLKGEKEEILKKMIQIGLNHDSKVLVTTLPSPEKANDMLHDEVEKITKELNVDYLDMNYPDKLKDYTNQVDLSCETYDMVHLNINGAVKTSKYLAKYIDENYDFNPYNKNHDYDKAVLYFHNKYQNYLKD